MVVSLGTLMLREHARQKKLDLQCCACSISMRPWQINMLVLEWQR
jgi:hypothetical protein